MSAVMRTLPPQAVEEAEDAIRRALVADVTPNIKAIATRVGLSEDDVSAIRDRLLSGKRDVRPGYRDPGRVAPPVPRPAAAPKPPTPSAVPATTDLVEQCLTHADPRVRKAATVAAAKRAAFESALSQLASALEGSATRDARAARRAELLAELAELDAASKSRTVTSRPRWADLPRVPCPDCGAMILPARMAQHRRLAAAHDAS